VEGEAKGQLEQVRAVLSARGLVSLAGGGTVTSVVVASIAVMPESGAKAGLAVAVLGFWAWYLLHLHLGYAIRMPATMAADGSCVLGVTVPVAVICVLWTPSALGMAIVAAAVLGTMVVRTGVSADDAAAHPELISGTEWMCDWPLVMTVEKALRRQRWFGRPLLGLLRFLAPTRDTSCFVTTLLVVLATVTGAAVANTRAVHGAFHVPGHGWGRGADIASDATSNGDLPYDKVCAGLPTPGDGAPEPVAEFLRAVWLGGEDGDGHQIGGMGAGVGGCADTAVESAARAGTWVVGGYCGDELRSLAVVTPDGHATIMLGQVAVFANGQLAAGKLLGASERVNYKHGDLQSVSTTDGSYVLVRSEASGGELPVGTKLRLCAQSTDKDSPYTIVVPGALLPWEMSAEHEWVWPQLHAASSTGAVYTLRSAGGERIDSVQCDTPLSCVSEAGTVGTAGDSDAAAAELLRLPHG
jgi:hypothetical protein